MDIFWLLKFLFESMKQLRMKFRNFLFPGWNRLNMRMCTAWTGDAHTLLLGAGSFIALMVAGLITSASSPLENFGKYVH